MMPDALGFLLTFLDMLDEVTGFVDKILAAASQSTLKTVMLCRAVVRDSVSQRLQRFFGLDIMCTSNDRKERSIV
jgi:hypothetical protein